MNTSDHTSKQFDVELEAIRAYVLQMGGLVENQIKLAIESLAGNCAPPADSQRFASGDDGRENDY